MYLVLTYAKEDQYGQILRLLVDPVVSFFLLWVVGTLRRLLT